uniref:CCHC-type domain-containing protein n=1 Tax=Fagus sylvatica TaxID=28930 RepID=A0A2N9EJB2_FAGSY
MVSEPSMASSDSNSRTTTPNPPLPTIQAPLLLLSNMANLMSIKLDSTNFIVWKHQLSSILKAYSMIDFVDGTVPSPSRFLVNPEGNLTTTVNPEFQIWNIRDQALLTLINSTLSQPVLSMVVGQNSAQSVWKTLEHRFTSTSRANVLNLKIELHNLKKGSETVSSYLQKVKNTRDKLIAVGTLIDNEEMLHIILKGLPKEYGPFCSAIRTRNEPVSFEEIMVLLQTEEQSIAEVVDSSKDMHSMAMNNSQRGRGGRYNHTNYTNQYSNNQFPTSNSFTQNHSSQSQGKSDGTRPTCQICGKSGHQALDCYHRMDFAYQGATDHLTSNLNNLTVQAPHKGSDQVAVGNGQSIPINNIGTGFTFGVRLLYKGLSENGFYPIHTHHLSHSSVKPVTASVKPVIASHVSPSISAFLSSKNKWQLWHHRLGHPSDRVLVNSSSPVTSTFDLVPWLSGMIHTCTAQSLLDSINSLSSHTSPILFTDIPTLTQTSSPTDQEVSSPITHSPHEPNSPSASLPIESTIVPSASLPIAPSAPVNTHPMNTRSKHGIFKPKSFHTTTTDYTHTEPPTYQIASKFPQWCSAMDEEFSALQRQQTWSLVPPPFGKNIVGCKWVFKLKRHSDGSISRYKARLVAKGFHQQHGIDFEETFSSVVKPPTIRLILALAVTYNWPLRQLDIRNAFLHGFLKEEVYMIQPPGYVDPHHPQHVCRLQKSIYGLKQAPRAWFESFTTQLLNLAFQSSHANSSLFIYKEGSVIAFLLLYVDDIVLTGNNVQFITQLITNLSKVFELKDMGTLSYFLGLQIQRSLDGLSLTQTKYATDLLTKHNMLNSLHYLTFTRPDLSFAVHQVCQFMNTPTDIHLTATKRILRYLRGTLDHGLHYTPGPISISAFSDADWAGDPNDRRSTSGLLFFLGNNPITWSAKKQLTVSRSSTEAEYRALASASAELCWLRTLLKDLGLYLHDPPILWCDNISALAIASNPVFHARTKHIEVDFHFIRERVLRKDLQTKHIDVVDPEVAEAAAILWAVQLAKLEGFLNVVIESDSKVPIDAINSNPEKANWKISTIRFGC